MGKYRVRLEMSYSEIYEVEAESAEEARRLYGDENLVNVTDGIEQDISIQEI